MTGGEYLRNHKRVYAERGRAKDLRCIDCEKPAQHWCHRHDTDPTDVANYDPRCVPCHAVYDGLTGGTRRPRTPEERRWISEGVRRWRDLT